jgi:hypothetical protein
MEIPMKKIIFVIILLTTIFFNASADWMTSRGYVKLLQWDNYGNLLIIIKDSSDSYTKWYDGDTSNEVTKPTGVDGSNTIIIKSDNDRIKEMYALLLTALAMDKTVKIYVNSEDMVYLNKINLSMILMNTAF